ncbi:hypothetical protein SK128_017557 [Halocaridina rubra]|uniref:D-dopachrome decarboxylase n=1 Tax=Halocaridina rubra TaxID=373956 RepID=A0AAN8WRB6_HALRR
MPLVTLKTNISSEKIPSDFHVHFTKKLSEVMEKPQERISVTVETEKSMARGGSMDPVCELHIITIGFESKEKTLPLTQEITQYLAEQTGIPPLRIVIYITSVQPTHIGCNGRLMG